MGQNVFKKRAAFLTKEGSLFRSCAWRCKRLSRERGLPYWLEYSANAQYSILQAFDDLPTGSGIMEKAYGLTVDVAILNGKGEMVLAFEYDGKGHNPKNDNRKLEVLGEIGVRLISINDPDSIKSAVKEAFKHL